MRIDAHQHFWHYTDDEYGWITDAMAAIRRDFLPRDLVPLLDEASIDATIAVHARQSLHETNWLLDLAEEHAWIAGVVGWVPLAEAGVNAEAEKALALLVENHKLKGVRHALQGEPDEYFERDDFNAGVGLLRKYSLSYDLLILEHQLPMALRFVDRHPEQPIVLDHAAKPLIAAQVFEPWRARIHELARRPHVSCKLSGLVAEADYEHWTVDDLLPYAETVLEAFGPKRILFGSDWPVCTVGVSYSHWAAVVHDFIAQLSVEEQDAILGGNAARFYGISQIQ
ncbi:amidohydrolase family protein [Acidicapsa ligni]|uniref:amidohydrolase family protein n=1 Tax=Acidicapsa ligni TaxID=542300 RepID=UPI0021E0A571|nr:amidohydrolase family protein [Acidicapsa ligni]